MKTLFSISLLAASTVLLASCQHKVTNTSLSILDTIPVTLIQLEQSKQEASIEATGVFTTEDETFLSFKNGGVIDRIYVQEGDKINKGQILARTYNAEINAKAGQVNLSVEKAQRDYDRTARLFRDSVATLEQLQNTKTALELAKQDLASVSFNQAYGKIIAPNSGYVLAKLANEGQVMGPGTPVLQVNGATDTDWILKVGVSDNQWMRIQVGDQADIQSDALSQQNLLATVFKKSAGLDPRSGTFAIYLKLQDKKSKLAAGVFGKALIHIQSQQSNTAEKRIPYAALLEAQGNAGYVFITEDGKTAKKQKVTISKIQDDYVLISSGLDHVNNLIVAGSPYLVDGSPIQVKSSLNQ